MSIKSWIRREVLSRPECNDPKANLKKGDRCTCPKTGKEIKKGSGKA